MADININNAIENAIERAIDEDSLAAKISDKIYNSASKGIQDGLNKTGKQKFQLNIDGIIKGIESRFDKYKDIVDLNKLINLDRNELKKTMHEFYDIAYNSDVDKSLEEETRDEKRFLAAATVAKYRGIKITNEDEQFALTDAFHEGYKEYLSGLLETLKANLSPFEMSIRNIGEIIKKSSIDNLLPEYGFLGNKRTGTTDNLIKGEVSSLSVSDLLQGDLSNFDSFFHSHSNEYSAAFSYDDIRMAAQFAQKGITNFILQSINDIASFDYSSLTGEELKEISDYIENELKTTVDGVTASAVDEDKAYQQMISDSSQKLIDSIVQSVIKEVQKVKPEINVEETKKNLYSYINDDLFKEGSYDDFYENLNQSLESFNDDHKIFEDNSFSDQVQDSIISLLDANYQETIFKEALAKTNEKREAQGIETVDISSIYKKINIDEFKKLAPAFLGLISVNDELIQSEEKVVQAKKKEKEENLQSDWVRATDELSKSFTTSGKREAKNQLEDAYKLYTEYEGDRASIAGKELEYEYLKSYENAVKSKIAPKFLEQYDVTEGNLKNTTALEIALSNIINDLKEISGLSESLDLQGLLYKDTIDEKSLSSVTEYIDELRNAFSTIGGLDGFQAEEKALKDRIDFYQNIKADLEPKEEKEQAPKKKTPKKKTTSKKVEKDVEDLAEEVAGLSDTQEKKKSSSFQKAFSKKQKEALEEQEKAVLKEKATGKKQKKAVETEESKEKTEALEKEAVQLKVNETAIGSEAEAEKAKSEIRQAEITQIKEKTEVLEQEKTALKEEEAAEGTHESSAVVNLESKPNQPKEEAPDELEELSSINGIKEKTDALIQETTALELNKVAIEAESEAERIKNTIRQEEIATIREKIGVLEAEAQALKANKEANKRTFDDSPKIIDQEIDVPSEDVKHLPIVIDEEPKLEHVEGEVVDGDYELIDAIKNEKIGAINLEADAMDAAANRETAAIQSIIDKVRELTRAIGEDKIDAIQAEVDAMAIAAGKEAKSIKDILKATQEVEQEKKSEKDEKSSETNKAATAENKSTKEKYDELAKAASKYYQNLYNDAAHYRDITTEEAETLERLEAEYRQLGEIEINRSGSEASVRAAEKAIKSFSDKMSIGNGQQFLMSQLNNITGAFSKYETGYSDKLKNQIQELTDEASKLKAEIDSIGDSDSFSKLIPRIEEFRTEVEGVLSGAPSQQFASANAVEKQLVNISRTLEQNTAMSSSLETRYRNLFNTIRDAVNPTKEDIKKFGLEIQALDKELYQSGKTGKSFYDTFAIRAKGLMAQTIAQWLSFQDIIRYIRTAVTAIIQLDDALVDLKKTTSMTSTELNQFYFDANEVAIRTGVTTAEIIQAAADWSRLGYSTKEAATQMAELSSQFAAVSPGMSTEKSQEGLVSIMKAYDIATEDVERKIMDNINTLGNNFAETNEDIIDGLERAGATLSAIGTSVEDSFALFTGAQEVIQNAETVGVALKTLSLRIRGYDEETEQLSDDVVEATGKVIDLTKTASNPEGISLFTDATQTQYKSMVQYLGEIADIWDQLSAKNQTALLENLFGKRGASVGSAILGNYDQIRSALEQMETAAGSADREMEIVRDKQNCPYVQQCA